MSKCLLVVLFIVPGAAFGQDQEQRFNIGFFFTGIFLEEIGSRDVGPGTSAAGLGGRIAYRILPNVDLDADVIIHPNAGVSGERIQGLFGVKAGKQFEKVGLFIKARPGFLYFTKDPFGVADRDSGSDIFSRNWASSMEPSMDIGGVFEYYTERGPVIRFDLGDTIVNYERRTVVISDFVPTREAGGFTTHNRQWSIGLGFRF
jgi:hypothetical protein